MEFEKEAAKQMLAEAANVQYNKVEFPLTDKELTTFVNLLNSIDFAYFEQVPNTSAIRDEDIEKIAVVKHCLEQFNDVISSRISWYENECALALPTGEALEAILRKYY